MELHGLRHVISHDRRYGKYGIIDEGYFHFLRLN
jgi:hypothetical protein